MIVIPQTLAEIDVIIRATRPKNGQAMRLRQSWCRWYSDDLTWYEATQDPQTLKNGQDRLIAFCAANGGANPAVAFGADAQSMPTLRLGSTGDAVSTWQKGIGMTPTAKFDNATLTKTKAWQSSKGLKPDGVVGPQSWGTIQLGSKIVPVAASQVVSKVMSTLKGNVGVVAAGAALGIGAAVVLSKK